MGRHTLPLLSPLARDERVMGAPGSGSLATGSRRGRSGVAARPWLLATLLAFPADATAAEVAGIQLADRATVGASDLVLNGAGLRRKLFSRVYVVALYLTERQDSATEVLALAGPKRVSVVLLRTVPAPRLVDALEDAIRRNSSAAQYRAVEAGVAELFACMLTLAEGEKGDIVAFDWLPEEGTLVLVNGVPRGTAVPGADVYVALLKVWLGDRPTNAGLKEALLGQAN